MLKVHCTNTHCPCYQQRSRCFQQDKYQFCENFKLYQLRSQSQQNKTQKYLRDEEPASTTDCGIKPAGIHISIPDEMAYRLMQMNLLHPSDAELETMDESILAKCRRDGL